jgi:hypothetical protein
MFEVLAALGRECSGNWTIQLVRLVLRSKKQHKFHHLYVPYSKQQFHWLVNGLKFVGLLAWVQKLGAQKSIPANLFPFLDRGNYSRAGKNGVLVTSWAQARLRFAHLQLRLKQQLLRSKDRNGNCSCRDSDVEYAVTTCTGPDCVVASKGASGNYH